MKAFETGLRIKHEDREKINALGYFVYDVRHNDDGEVDTIEHHVVVNHRGTLITDTELNIPSAPNDYIEEWDLDFDYNNSIFDELQALGIDI